MSTTDSLVAAAGRSASKAAEWTARRNSEIVTALEAGASSRTIARATGLSHTAVAKIGKAGGFEGGRS